MSISDLTIFHFSRTRMAVRFRVRGWWQGYTRVEGRGGRIVICRLRDRIFTVRLAGHSAYKRVPPSLFLSLCIF